MREGPRATGSYIGLEAAAGSIRINAHVVPSIFQTPGYAREVITRTRPAITAEDIARTVAARSARQEALFGRDESPQIHVVLDEAALHREVGGPETIRDQLMALAGVTVRPYGHHPGTPVLCRGARSDLEMALHLRGPRFQEPRRLHGLVVPPVSSSGVSPVTA